ncbi:MAG: hypothetical protein Q7J35_01460 [Candidatus Methanoperedens sp.]|nr:hypothetical protein [Candidatus Methanoperedens sp.]
MGILYGKKPQIKAPRVTPLEGVSTYALRGIGVRGVENPQGFGIDERRFVVPYIEQLYPAILSNSPQSSQSSQRLFPHLMSEIGHVCPSRGIRGCALQRRDSGRHYLRLIFEMQKSVANGTKGCDII